MRPLTEQQLLQLLPNARQVSGFFVPALNRAMTRFRIDSQVRRAAFLAQVGHEPGHLRRLVENLNYSAAGLAATWPGRYRAADGQPNDLARRLERQPQRIANHVYANRLGNGSVESGYGWRYRGARAYSAHRSRELSSMRCCDRCGSGIAPRAS